MGKAVKYTGSKMLGAEMRRLRGARRLEDISRLSKESPLTSRVQPVSAPALSQIENGVSMPTSEMLYTLSVLYNVSPSRLLNLIVEEKLTKAQPAMPATREETRDRLSDELSRGNWYEALALAIHGSSLASSASDGILWTANRALAMRRLGMRSDALLMLLECAQSPALASEHRYIPHAYLADAFSEAGLLLSAADHLAHALRLADGNAPAGVRGRLNQARIAVTLRQYQFSERADEAGLHATLQLIKEQRATDLREDDALVLDIYEAECHGFLGNTLVAVRDLEAAAVRAEAAGAARLETSAWLASGHFKRCKGRHADARAAYERAENRAVEGHQHDEAFAAYFALALLSAETGDGQEEWHLRRCLRYWPLVQTRTPDVQAFEAMLREGKVR